MPAGCVIEEQIDYNAHDIKMIPKVKNHEACAKQAAANEKAKFWTYQASTKKCFIKTSKKGHKPNKTAVSGNKECGVCVIEKQIDYNAHDIKMIPKVENHEACAKQAAAHEKAKFWTYQAKSKKCWIKTSKKGKKSNKTVVSGNRECGV